MIDSTPTQPADLGPQFPTYPQLSQIVRVAGGPTRVEVNDVYPCFVQQVLDTLSLRDREPGYVVEPSGAPLGPAYYEARLVGSYNSLPLFETWCC